MAKSVSIYPIGVGDSFTTRHFFMNCLLDVDGREFFIDCPAYVNKMLSENNLKGEVQLDLTRYRELMVTHVHADHIGGVEELAYWQYYKTENRVKMYAPDWMLRDVWSHLRPALEPSVRPGGGMMNFDDYFEPVAISNPHDFGGFTLEYRYGLHFPKTLMYKFDFGGVKLGYLTDTGLDKDNIDWVSDCDVIMHDAWFGPVEIAGGDIRNMHAPIADLLKLPEEIQRKTLLIHYADGAYENDPDKPSFDIGKFRLARQGKKYTII